MIKDRVLKTALLDYFLRKYWYPQLEVNVLSKKRFSDVPKLITDIDVLALYPDITGSLKPIFGDCKTLKNQSPITRSLWMKGLMSYLGADKAIIILSKEIEKEHQLTSNYLDVQIFSDRDFTSYSTSTADYTTDINSALASPDFWDIFFDIDKKFPLLKLISDFSRTSFWNDLNSNNKLRLGIHLLKSIKAELNPSNSLHLAIVLNHFSLIAIALNEVIIQIFNRYSAPKSINELNNDLKVLIYGGIANYEFLNEIRRRFTSSSTFVEDLALPEWQLFLELVRLTFENPLGFSKIPLFLKEISFMYLAEDPSKYTFYESVLDLDKHISNFSLRFTYYVTKACSLPPEFYETYANAIAFKGM